MAQLLHLPLRGLQELQHGFTVPRRPAATTHQGIRGLVCSAQAPEASRRTKAPPSKGLTMQDPEARRNRGGTEVGEAIRVVKSLAHVV